MLLLLIVGCTEPYDVDLGSAGPGLAVEGSVTTDSAYQQVILTQTANYFYNKPAEGINTASVSVTFNGHTVAYNYVEGSRGVYQSAYAFKGKEGTRYTLYIDSVSFNGGDTYQSYVASDSMCSIIPIDSISVDYDDPIEAWWIRIYTLEPGDTENWYIFKAGINQHMVTDTISEWNHTIDKFLNGEYLYGVDVQYLQDEYDDERPSVGDTIWLYMENVSEGVPRFLRAGANRNRTQNTSF